MDPTLVLEHRFRLTRGFATAAEWADEENAKGRTCACGCGASIKVIARHKWHGIPRYLKAHHPMKMTKEVAAVRADGFMTSHDAAHALGIGVTTLLRMEGVAYEPMPRRGKRRIRLFTPEILEAVRAFLAREHGGR